MILLLTMMMFGTYSKKQTDKDKVYKPILIQKVTIVDDLISFKYTTGTSLETIYQDSGNSLLHYHGCNFTIVNISGNSKNTQSFTGLYWAHENSTGK